MISRFERRQFKIHLFIFLTLSCHSFCQIRQYSKYRYLKVPKRLQIREVKVNRLNCCNFENNEKIKKPAKLWAQN